MSKNGILLATAAYEAVDDSIKKNVSSSSGTGLEVRVTRVYDGVGVHDGKESCQWCLDRCGTNMTLQEAYAKGAFQRHPGCGCEIEYTSAKGVITRQRRAGGRNSWEEDEEREERIRADRLSEMDGTGRVVESCKADNVSYLEVAKQTNSQSDDDIIAKVGGGDKTKGSCQSAALAYAGNKAGYDVRDFRGGRSCEIFSQQKTLKDIAKSKGVRGFIVRKYDGYDSANSAIKLMEKNKEYILATGKHTAIVRLKQTKGVEFLELQDPRKNGFENLTTKKLKSRFGVTKQHTIYGIKLEQESVLIDIESLKDNSGFQEMLGYINTAAENQMKGAVGRVK